jgi:hypothetical protein
VRYSRYSTSCNPSQFSNEENLQPIKSRVSRATRTPFIGTGKSCTSIATERAAQHMHCIVSLVTTAKPQYMKPIIRLLDAQSSSIHVVVCSSESRTACRKYTTTLGHVVGRAPRHFKKTNDSSSGVCDCTSDVVLFTLMHSDMPLSSMESDVLCDRAN